MPQIEIFRAGTHTGMDKMPRTFTRDDIAAIAGGYSVAAHHAPVVVGHPNSDGPAYAWVKGLSARDDVLVADVDQLDPDFQAMVQKGRFKYVSSAFFMPDEAHNPTPGRWALRHVGFLGAQAPAVKGLKTVQFADGAAFVAFMAPWQQSTVARLLRGLREYIIGKDGQDAADKVLPSWDIDNVAEPPPAAEAMPAYSTPPNPKETTLSEQDVAEAARLRAEAEKLARERAELDTQRVAFAQAETARRTAEDATFVDGLVKAGKLLPANKADTLALLATLPTAAAAGTGMVAFSTGERTPHQALRDLLDRQPAVVKFGQAAAGGGDGGADLSSSADIEQRAGAYIKRRSAEGFDTSIAEAIAAVTQGATA